MSLNSKIDVAKLDAKMCHAIYFFYSKSELENIPNETISKGSKIILKVIKDINPIIKENAAEIAQDNFYDAPASPAPQAQASQRNQTAHPKHPKSDEIKKVSKFTTKQLVEKLQKASLIQKHWLVTHLMESKDSPIPQEYLFKQKGTLEKLLLQRDKNIGFFNRYLKQGKKTSELLNSKLFSGFKNEAIALMNGLNQQNLSSKEDFFEKYYQLKGAEESKLNELTFIRMLYEIAKKTKLSKIIHQAHQQFPPRKLPDIKRNVLNHILK